MTIQTSINAIWAAVKASLVADLEDDHPDVGFHEWATFYSDRNRSAIVVVDRRLRTQDSAVRLLLGELMVEFGCMVRSGEPTKGREEAELLAYWLADHFMADPHLGGVSRNVRDVEIDFMAEPPPETGDDGPQNWVNVTVVWEADFSRP